MPTAQCCTCTSAIAKAVGLSVASGTPRATAVAAIRQSACASVMPMAACSRRHSPARTPSAWLIRCDPKPGEQPVDGGSFGGPDATMNLLDVDRGGEQRLAVLT